MTMYEDGCCKGGSIKRVAQALDARLLRSSLRPLYEDRAVLTSLLLTRLPKAGHVGIYDRSWYGCVLVERVEGFASPPRACWRQTATLNGIQG